MEAGLTRSLTSRQAEVAGSVLHRAAGAGGTRRLFGIEENFLKSLQYLDLKTRAESSLRSGVFHYYNISRTIWMIESLKIVTYVLWLLTCWYMSCYCTMLCNLGTSILYSYVFHNVRVLHHVMQLLN